MEMVRCAFGGGPYSTALPPTFFHENRSICRAAKKSLVVLSLQFGTARITLRDLIACHCYNDSFVEFHV